MAKIKFPCILKTHLKIPHQELVSFCQRWQIVELALFGSVLRYDFKPDSDVDVMIRFDHTVRYSLFDMVTMQEELQKILGWPVDLIERNTVEKSRNYIRRNAILKSAELICAA